MANDLIDKSKIVEHYVMDSKTGKSDFIYILFTYMYCVFYSL